MFVVHSFIRVSFSAFAQMARTSTILILFQIMNFWISNFYAVFQNSTFFWKITNMNRLSWVDAVFYKRTNFPNPFRKKIETREFCNSLRPRSVFLFWRGVLIHLQSTVECGVILCHIALCCVRQMSTSVRCIIWRQVALHQVNVFLALHD